MIELFKSCSVAISSYLVNNEIESVYLPDDICDSLIEKLKHHNIKYNFYSIKRGWGDFDHYDFDGIPKNELIIVSDLFNFRNINVYELKNRKIALDLAHCSIETAKYYLELFKGDWDNISFLCISMGKGKYYRFGGGGLLIENDGYNHIDSICFESVNYSDPGLNGNFELRTNSSSTRMVLSADEISESEVQEMRSKGFSISDGLYNHIKGNSAKEYYLWKVDKR
ncbi:conserved hypothetical protein [Vibrio chagasii]|nr:conserved hypothetical protein [Vibrio chagasii]CAH7155448.1 conserved hypothetical protein [Vibrio chagasii]CAH7210708.1 conserved hypothetical protein [Vibrio chagasii]